MPPDRYCEQFWTYHRVISEYVGICRGELVALGLDGYAGELTEVLGCIDANGYRLAVVKLTDFLNEPNMRRVFGESENTRVSATPMQLALARPIDLREFVDTFGLPQS